MQPTTSQLKGQTDSMHDWITLVTLAAIGISAPIHLLVAVAVMNDSVTVQRGGRK